VNPNPDNELLTVNESNVLRQLAEAWNQYIELPEVHPQDRDEFMRAIHAAQNIVLARPATKIEMEKRKAKE
jgi:hypothetical protein